MRRESQQDRLRKNRRSLYLEFLESRLPVSEQIGAVLSLVWMSSATEAWQRSADSSKASSAAIGERRQLTVSDPAKIAVVPRIASGRDESSRQVVSGNQTQLIQLTPRDLDALWDPDSFGLFGTTQAARPHSLGAVREAQSGVAVAGDSSGPAFYQVSAGRGSDPVGGTIGSVAYGAAPSALSLAGSGTSATATQSETPATDIGPTLQDAGSQNQEPHGPTRPLAPAGGVMWILDAKNGLALTNGFTFTPITATFHDFAQWSVDLRMQVTGFTVASNGYSWNLSQAPDVDLTTVQGSDHTYNLKFNWLNFTDTAPHTDTIIATATGSGTNPPSVTQTITLNVIPSNSPAWAQQPTFNWPTVLPPDAVTAEQEMISRQYYSLGVATGEVQTSHTLPTYNPGIPPVRLIYSSTAADARPIFIVHYQLDPTQPVPASVQAQLTLNGVAGTPVTYATNTLNKNLNPGDIMQIALQGDATGLSTGRYSYQIDITGSPNVSYPGSVNIINSSGSNFGAGWSLDNIEKIWPVTGGVILEVPGGKSLWFSPGSCGHTYCPPPGDSSFSTIDLNAGVYTRILKDGMKHNFNAQGYETSIVEPHQLTVLNFNYDANNRLTQIVDWNGLSTTLAYDSGSGKLTSVSDPAGRVAQLAYDATKTQLTSITDPNPGGGQQIPVWNYSYDSANRMLTLQDPRQYTTSFAYNSAGRIGTVTRPDLNTETMNPLQMQGLVPATPPVLAAQAQAVYSDPRSRSWATRLDWLGFGHNTQPTDPLGDMTVIHRDNNGLPWLSSDPLGRFTRTFFDQAPNLPPPPAIQGNPVRFALIDGSTMDLQYNALSRPLSFKDPNGNVTSYTYDSAGCCQFKIVAPTLGPPNGGSPTWNYSYTAHDFLQTITDPNSHATTLSYDTRDRATTITYAADAGPNPQVVLGYNSASDLISRQDENGLTTTYNPDNLGRVLNIVQPATAPNPNPRITMTYDAAGNRTSVTDPDNNTTSFVYDSLNRRVNTIDPTPQRLLTTYSYDQAGNLQSIIDRRGLKRQFTYDDASRKINEQWFDATGALTRTMTYTYNAASQLATAADPDSLYTYSYDNRGRLRSVNGQITNGPPAVLLNYGYDATGNRTSVTDNMGGTISYVYDADNRLIGEGMVTGGSGTPQVSLGYDLAANLTSVTRNTTSSMLPTISTAIAYTNRNAVKQIAHTSSQAGALGTFTYNYDPGLRITSATETGLATLTYQYDNVNELTGVSGGRTENYGYDLAGNRNTGGYQTDPGNRLRTDGTFTYTYDNEGNLLTKSGNGQVTTYTWDNRERLISVQNTAANVNDTFKYDVFNRRIGRLVQGGVQQWTIYDGANPYADFSGSSLTFRYLYSNAIDGLFARYNGTTTAWYLRDNLASTRNLVDTSGTILNKVTYGDSFGSNPVDSVPGNGDRFKYAAREFDSEIGLYQDRARSYNPAVGRFVSEDPIKFFGGDANLYRYVHNNPVRFVDPSGLNSVAIGVVTNPTLGPIVAEVLGTGAVVVTTAYVASRICYHTWDTVRRAIDLSTAETLRQELEGLQQAQQEAGQLGDLEGFRDLGNSIEKVAKDLTAIDRLN